MESNEINFSQGFSQKVVSTSSFVFNSLPAKGDFCWLLISFAKSLDPDQARQNVGPDLDPNCLTLGLKKSSIQSVKYGTTIKCEGLKIQKLIKMHFFANMGDFKNNASISLIHVYRLSKADLLLKLISRYVINVFFASCQVSLL